MYSVGDMFKYEIDGEKLNFTVIGNFISKGKEFLVVEDDSANRYIFTLNEDEEITLIDDEIEAEKILSEWDEDYYCHSSMNDNEIWDEEDEFSDKNEKDELEDYFEDNYDEENDDDDYIGSYVDEEDDYDLKDDDDYNEDDEDFEDEDDFDDDDEDSY